MSICICRGKRHNWRCDAHPRFLAPRVGLTPKQNVLAAEPKARLDYYESLRRSGQPCWFIRIGFQGSPLSAISQSPRQAWASAYRDGLLASFNRMARRVQRRRAR